MRRFAVVIGSVALFAAACTKGENAGGGTGAGSSPSGGATSSVTPVPLASSAPLPTGPASAVTITAADAAAPVGSLAKDSGAVKNATAHVAGKNFALDLASPGCKTGIECAMTIRLKADAGFHINKQYPYKFLANADPAVTFLGKTAPTTFSREGGEFTEEGEKAAVMTVRFKPASAGQAKIAGTYKLSVCSDDQCQIEQEKIELLVPVL